MAGNVGKTVMAVLGLSMADDEAPTGNFLERKLLFGLEEEPLWNQYTYNDVDGDGWGDPYSNYGGAYNSSSPKHYIYLHEGYCYGVAEDHEWNAYLPGGAYEGKPETTYDIRIDLYANGNEAGWNGGTCYMESQGEFTLAADKDHDVWYGHRNGEIPMQIWCDPGPDPLNQYGNFSISYLWGMLEYEGIVVNDTDFTWPPDVDAMASNEDWCARYCALSGEDCRFFTYDSDDGYCRFHEKKGGCHPQPTSHRRRYGSSNAYLIPEEFQTELSVEHIVAALEEGRDYVHTHDGFCASGWISGMINHRSTLDACARWCRDVPVCGYFTFSAAKESCALYDTADECPSHSTDHSEEDFRSFQLIRPDEDDDHYSDYQLVHMGFCDYDYQERTGSDFLGYDYDRQFAYVFDCAEYCHDTEGCEHFSFSRRNFHCRLFGHTCLRPSSPYGPWPSDRYHGEANQYGIDNNLQYGEHNMGNGFTWFWRANDWYPWALPNTTDYMYSSYHVNSASRRDPGVMEPSSFGRFVACGDRPNITLENDMVMECREFFPGYSCWDDQLTNYSYSNCSASCGTCTTYCYDTDINGRSNTHGYGCEIYNEMPILCDIADSYDQPPFFDAQFHCCACGGGARNVCLPDDFVEAPTPSGGSAEALVKSLIPGADGPESHQIVVEFPYITGAQQHILPLLSVTKWNGRQCSEHSMEMYMAGWES